ncbi:hypothetical protein Tco_0158453 [Tanacetum coccineum]
MYGMTSTRPDIAYDMGKLSTYTSNPSTHHWNAITRKIILLQRVGYFCLVEVPLHGLPRSKHSTIEAEFVALAAAGKEAEWLKNLIYEILLWPKPISPISIHCYSAATLAKVYCQIYNGKSRHLGIRHSMVRELITNGVIYMDFVRSQQNLADHFTKGLARDLVHKSAIGMGLKSIKISNDETPNSLPVNVGSRIQCGKLIFSDWRTFNSIIPRRLCITKRVWIPRLLSDRVQLKIDSMGSQPNFDLNLWDFGGKKDDCILGLTLAVNPSGSNIDMVDADADFAASF